MASSEDEGGSRSLECSFCEEIFDSEDALREHRKESHSKRVCSKCGEKLSHSPFKCNYCDTTFCTEHRLPENHNCPGLGSRDRETNSKEIMYMNSKKHQESANDVSSHENDEKVVKSQDSDINESNDGSEGKNVLPSSKNLTYPFKILKRKSLNLDKKVLPILGLVLLLSLFVSENSGSLVNDDSFSGSGLDGVITETLDMVQSSIVVQDTFQLAITLLTVFTIWSGFSYWLKDWKYIRRNSSLLEKLVVVFTFIFLIERHVVLDSALGSAADWLMFVLVLYLELAGTWFLMKTINGIDLSSDLYNWGLRLLGGATIFVGAIMFVSSGMAISVANSELVFNNVYWIGSVCMMLLGAFMEYRSFRRHPAVHVW